MLTSRPGRQNRMPAAVAPAARGCGRPGLIVDQEFTPAFGARGVTEGSKPNSGAVAVSAPPDAHPVARLDTRRDQAAGTKRASGFGQSASTSHRSQRPVQRGAGKNGAHRRGSFPAAGARAADGRSVRADGSPRAVAAGRGSVTFYRTGWDWGSGHDILRRWMAP